MVDFEPGEKLYAINLDPDDPNRVKGCFFQGQTNDGEIVVGLRDGINETIRTVPLTDIYKDVNEAHQHLNK